MEHRRGALPDVRDQLVVRLRRASRAELVVDDRRERRCGGEPAQEPRALEQLVQVARGRERVGDDARRRVRVRRADLEDFVAAYKPGARGEREECERWKSFTYDEITARDKANLDITWLRDESLEDLDNLPSPDVLAREIVEDLTAALEEFEAVATALEEQLTRPS